MKLDFIVRDISAETLNDNERELIECFRRLNDVDKASLIHILYSSAFEGVLSEINNDNNSDC